MKIIKKIIVQTVKQTDIASALAVRLTKLTGKSKVPVHPKHLLTQKPWFAKYLTKKDVVLDLGCGNGQNAIKASKFVQKMTACDIDTKLLSTAKEQAKLKHVKNIKFETANLEEKLKYPNNTFDKIIFLDVLEHLMKREQILTEIKRVLKPKGHLFLGVPNSQTSWKKFQRSAGVCSYSDPDHKIEFSEASIRKLLVKNGFKIINFGYGKYDIALRGIIDVIGAISLTFYGKITGLRQSLANRHPQQASGFEIICINSK